MQRLTRLYRDMGQSEQAIPIIRSLLAGDPTLEDIVRDLYRCYQETGDLTALIREERHLRQALQEAYADPDDPEVNPTDYHSEPETIALFNEIRRDLEARATGN